MAKKAKRFKVALTFAGENRRYVEAVANRLKDSLGQESVFYDEWYKAELARPNLDTYLQSIYHKQSDLVVVFLWEKYEEKDWCRLEWRAVRDIIKRTGEHVMFFRFDEVTIPGLFSIDGYISLRKDPPEEAARHIFKRLQIESCLPETVVGHPAEGTAIDSGN